MAFHNKLYERRRQKGLSQEELVALGELFEISLDELVLGKNPIITEKISFQPTADMSQSAAEKLPVSLQQLFLPWT